MGEDERPVIDPNRPEYVYRQLADHLAAQIASGKLPPGARLNGERDLAEEYGVAIGTARHAVEILRERGLVVTVPAKGTFVVEPPPPGDG